MKKNNTHSYKILKLHFIENCLVCEQCFSHQVLLIGEKTVFGFKRGGVLYVYIEICPAGGGNTVYGLGHY